MEVMRITKGIAEPEKKPLLDELEFLREALESDHSGGACLPTRTYWDLRSAIVDAKSFLRFRTRYKTCDPKRG